MFKPVAFKSIVWNYCHSIKKIYNAILSPSAGAMHICVRLGSTSNPQIDVQFSNLWPFLTFSNRRPMTSLTYSSNDITPVSGGF